MASTKRERELARLRAERQAARRAAEAAARRRRLSVVASVVAVLVVVGAVLAISLHGKGHSSPTASASPKASGPCTYTKAGEASKKADLPPATPTTTGPTTATVVTSQGTVAFSLDTAKAPCTSNSIISLAAQHFYDGTPCHRLTSGGLNVLQCGDPSGTGSGGPGYQFGDENLTGATYPAGTVAMANSGPNTNGSQFFLVYADSTLGPNYTPVGKITSGLDVLQKIAAGGEDPAGDGKPKTPVTITTFTTAPDAGSAAPAPAPSAS